MTRPLRIVVANDNAPVQHRLQGDIRRNGSTGGTSVFRLPSTAPVADSYASAPDWIRDAPETDYVSAAPASPEFRERMGAMLGIWALVLGALATLSPGLLPAPVLASGGVAALLTALAILLQSRIVIGLSALAACLTLLMATRLAPLPPSVLVWSLGTGTLLALQAVIAIGRRSPLVAGAVVAAGLAAAGLSMLMLDTTLRADPLVLAPTALAALGLARAGVRRGQPFSAAAYFAAWTSCALGGLSLTFFGLSEGPVSISTLTLALSAAAALVWAAQGLHAAGQAAALLGISALWLVPGAQTWLADTLGAFGDEPLAPLLTASAVLSAGAALAIRGILNASPPALVTGALAMLGQTLVLVSRGLLDLNTLVILALALTAMTAWLLSARLN